ncbi:MAG: branched-chain amino acid ABC transporter permease [Chloroflexota bacterium]|nr:branched-chain amino acid ABC transporter permease [Chloroflexota bacterium]
MATITSRLADARPQTLLRRNWWRILLALIALVYPLVVRSYYLSLGIEVLIFAIFAMSLDLLLGYTGLASFGHAAFFGLGSYILAFAAIGLTANLFVTIPLVLLGTAIGALIIGFFALRTVGIYFLMITLAAAQMLFSIAIRWSAVTGGSDGLTGIPLPRISVGALSYTFASRESYYYLVLLLFLLSWWLMRRIVDSPFGWTLRGIRENEQRMLALGYNTFRYKVAVFVIGGAFAGVAGALLTHFFWHATPETLYWTTSGQVLIMLIVGGTGTLAGPILGAAMLRLLPNFASTYTERWQTILGLVLILFVLFAPKGIMGLIRRYQERSNDEPVEG